MLIKLLMQYAIKDVKMMFHLNHPKEHFQMQKWHSNVNMVYITAADIFCVRQVRFQTFQDLSTQMGVLPTQIQKTYSSGCRCPQFGS